MAPQRRTFLPLSDRECLVVLKGATDVKDADDGTPRPVLLSLLPGSTFHDLGYLARQVVNFGAHSWRSFLPAPMPVTILYSQLVARLLGKLSLLDKWDPDVMLGKISNMRWFL